MSRTPFFFLLVSNSVSIRMTTFSAGRWLPQWNLSNQKDDAVLYALGWASLQPESLLVNLFGSHSAVDFLRDAVQVS